MTAEELDAIRKKIEAHDTDSVCLSMAGCCDVGSGEITRKLLAEVERFARFTDGIPLSVLVNLLDQHCEANGLDYDLVTKRKTALVRPEGGHA